LKKENIKLLIKEKTKEDPLEINKQKKTLEMQKVPVNPQKPDSLNTPSKTASSGGERSNTIRINVEILDQLMMLAGELVLVRNQHCCEVGANRSGLVVDQVPDTGEIIIKPMHPARLITIDGISTLILQLNLYLKVYPCIEKEEMAKVIGH